jgi:hypothetical protein
LTAVCRAVAAVAGASLRSRPRVREHLAQPLRQQRGVDTLARLVAEAVVGVAHAAVGQRTRLHARLAVAPDDFGRDDVVVRRLDQQHVATELGAGAQRPIRLRGHEGSAVAAQILLLVQLQLRQFPAGVDVERRHAQGQPRDRPHRRQDRRQVAAVAAADDGDRRRVDVGVRGQRVVGGEQIAQIAFARHRLALRLGPGMAAEVEGQADAAERGDLARTRQVLLLAAAPAVHEQHAGNQHARASRACRRCGRHRRRSRSSAHARSSA